MAKKQTAQTASLPARTRKRAKLAVVPHPANDFRPYAIRRWSLLGFVLLILFVQVFYATLYGGTRILGTYTKLTPNGLLEETNQTRADYGEKPLRLNDKLTAAAQMKAQNMFDEQYWDHVSPSNIQPWHWLDKADYTYTEAGENLAKNFTNNDTTVAAWMASPSHRDNIIKASYDDVGFAIKSGVLNGEETTIVVALYGSLQDANTPVTANTSVAAAKINVTMSPMTQVGLSLKSLSPVAIASVVILLVLSNIALLAHAYRDKLPPAIRRTWHRYHGIIKALGLVSIAVVLVLAYTNVGQL